MFYLAVIPSIFLSVLAFVVLILTFQESQVIVSLLDLTTVKGIAISILFLNLSLFGLIVFSFIFVPPSITLYYGLSVVFVTLMMGTWGVSALGSVTLDTPYGELNWISGSDPLLTMVLFVAATLFCVWKIDRLRIGI